MFIVGKVTEVGTYYKWNKDLEVDRIMPAITVLIVRLDPQLGAIRTARQLLHRRPGRDRRLPGQDAGGHVPHLLSKCLNDIRS